MSVLAWLGFVAGAAIGAPARYVLDGFVQQQVPGAFPWGTFVVNISGSFLLGILTGLALYHGFPAVDATILGTGFCGAYTTFSTFTFETVRLAEEGALVESFLNAAASLVAGLTAAGAGLALAGAW